MNIESLKIGYRTYRVEPLCAKEATSESRHGDINHAFGRIRIEEGLADDHAASVLVHEVLHGLFHDTGLDWTAEDEERMVERLTPRLCAFIADNPGAVAELVRALARRAQRAEAVTIVVPPDEDSSSLLDRIRRAAGAEDLAGGRVPWGGAEAPDSTDPPNEES